jgi:hypothetical protein
MQLFKDTHLVKLELLSNATTIDSALNYIKCNQQRQQAPHQSKKHLTLDSTDNDGDDDSIIDSDSDSNGDDDSQFTTTAIATGRQTVF